MSPVPRADPMRPRASWALDNLRGFVILLVLSFHSVLAYLDFLPASPFPFDDPPYLWRAFPVVDHQRWFGFDLFCAWQDVFLMSLFFFLFRLVLLSSCVPLLMPWANYPPSLQTTADPSLIGFWRSRLGHTKRPERKKNS